MNIKTDLIQKLLIGISCAFTMLAGSVVHALELQSEVSAGVGRSDNIARTAEDHIEETVGLVGLNLGLVEDTSRLTADVRAQFDYVYYADDTFDSELIGGLAGTAVYTIAEERLTWLFQENYGQQTVDPLSPSSPGNRENVSFFTTGPTLSLLPGSRNSIQVDLRYSTINYEIRETDNERQMAALVMGRQISRDAQLSLVGNTTQVDYKEESFTDFDRHEVFVRYEINGGRNTLGVDLGVTELEIAGETGDGNLVRLDWTRQISSDKVFTLSGGTSYSDQGDIFRFDQAITGDLRETSDIVGTAVPFTSNFITMSYGVNRERTSLNIGISWNQEDYQGGEPIDRDIFGINFDISREISDKIFANMNAQYRERDFKYLDTADDNLFAAVELGYRFGPSTSAALQYAYFERSGDTAFTVVRENRLFLRFFYTPAWGR